MKGVKREHLPLILLFISLFYLRSLVSISVGLMAVAIAFKLISDSRNGIKLKTNGWQLVLPFGLLYLFTVSDLIRADNPSLVLQEMLLKSPLIIVPLYLWIFGIKFQKVEVPMFVFTAILAFTAVVSVFNYWMHFNEINALLLQSKHVPIIGDTHHIYFGIYLSLGFWTSVHYAMTGRWTIYWKIVGLLLLFCIHILVSRTGLVALYVSMAIFLAWFIKSQWHRPMVRWMWLPVLFIPILAYQFSGSFRSKLSNSFEDFQALKGGGEANYKSLAMRVEAWKTTLGIIQQNPLTGTGSVAFEERLQQQYVKNATSLYPENRIGPHNQFLEVGAKYGILATLILVLTFIIGFLFNRNSIWMTVFLAIFMVSFLLESVLERQLGMIAFGLFYFLAGGDEEI